MTRLSVNVNKIATLRNSRDKNLPDLLKTTLDIVSWGAEGITVHPRPDERHIRRSDVYEISRALQKFPEIEFNIEGYPSEDFIALLEEVRPTQCTLVPDPPHVLTSNAGWRVREHLSTLQTVCRHLKSRQIRTSIFIDPMSLTAEDLLALPETQTDRIELYTEAYSDDFFTPRKEKTLAQFHTVATQVKEMGIGINAGHDLNLSNLRTFLTQIPFCDEVSIGHALICDALKMGLQTSVERYLFETHLQ